MLGTSAYVLGKMPDPSAHKSSKMSYATPMGSATS